MKHLYRDSFQPYRPALILSQQQVTQKINFQLFSSYLDNFQFSFAQTCYCKTFSADSELKGSLFFTRNIPRCLSSKGLCTTVFVFHSISSIRYPPVITQILFLVDIMTKKKKLYFIITCIHEQKVLCPYLTVHERFISFHCFL